MNSLPINSGVEPFSQASFGENSVGGPPDNAGSDKKRFLLKMLISTVSSVALGVIAGAGTFFGLYSLYGPYLPIEFAITLSTLAGTGVSLITFPIIYNCIFPGKNPPQTPPPSTSYSHIDTSTSQVLHPHPSLYPSVNLDQHNQTIQTFQEKFKQETKNYQQSLKKTEKSQGDMKKSDKIFLEEQIKAGINKLMSFKNARDCMESLSYTTTREVKDSITKLIENIAKLKENTAIETASLESHYNKTLEEMNKLFDLLNPNETPEKESENSAEPDMKNISVSEKQSKETKIESTIQAIKNKIAMRIFMINNLMELRIKHLESAFVSYGCAMSKQEIINHLAPYYDQLPELKNLKI